MLGIPLLEKLFVFVLFQSFLVSKLLGFKVVWFNGVLVSWLQSLKVYQMPISCFLEDIDPISKVFKNLFDGSPGLSAPFFSKKYKSCFLQCLKIICSKWVFAFYSD